MNIHHHKVIPNTIMCKNNDQAKISDPHLKPIQYLRNNMTPDHQNSRPMSQTLRKILFRATHRTKVQKQDEIENGTI